MKVLFCKISSMKYYKGVIEGIDEAYNGGSYVAEHGRGHEEYNFDPVTLDDGQEYCLGFVETKSSNSVKVNDLHIEKIEGCEALKKEESVDDVLVIWCATTDLNETSVVGWYDHATVYRTYQEAEFETGYIQSYNVLAKKEDCVLIPKEDRHMSMWNAPVAKKKRFGFGQSLVWFAREENSKIYVHELVKRIKNYRGENWVDVYPQIQE